MVWEKNPTHLVSKVIVEAVQEHTDLYLEVIIERLSVRSFFKNELICSNRKGTKFERHGGFWGACHMGGGMSRVD